MILFIEASAGITKVTGAHHAWEQRCKWQMSIRVRRREEAEDCEISHQGGVKSTGGLAPAKKNQARVWDGKQ